jgi:hypothetical protein
MGMSEKFDDIIAGLVSKIAGLVSKAERASASLREYSDHALALRFDREVAIVEFGDCSPRLRTPTQCRIR